jgi:hypothetical protein
LKTKRKKNLATSWAVAELKRKMQPDKKKIEKKSWKKNLKNILLDFFSDKKR